MFSLCFSGDKHSFQNDVNTDIKISMALKRDLNENGNKMGM